MTYRQTCDERVEELEVHLANISGALVDASTIPVGDESTYADGVRKLTAERDTAIAKSFEYKVLAAENQKITDDLDAERDEDIATARRQAIEECIAAIATRAPAGLGKAFSENLFCREALRTLLPAAPPAAKGETP